MFDEALVEHPAHDVSWKRVDWTVGAYARLCSHRKRQHMHRWYAVCVAADARHGRQERGRGDGVSYLGRTTSTDSARTEDSQMYGSTWCRKTAAKVGQPAVTTDNTGGSSCDSRAEFKLL